MRRLTKNLILATAVVSAIFIVDLSHVEANNQEKIYPPCADCSKNYLDFWGKFRDTVMPDPDEPQNNNPPKETEKPPPRASNKPKQKHPPKSENQSFQRLVVTSLISKSR